MTVGTYRVLVTGSRDWDDAMAAEWASDYGVRTEEHPADWGRLVADVCLAFIRGDSRDATRCADLAGRARIPVRRSLRPGAP